MTYVCPLGMMAFFSAFLRYGVHERLCLRAESVISLMHRSPSATQEMGILRNVEVASTAIVGKEICQMLTHVVLNVLNLKSRRRPRPSAVGVQLGLLGLEEPLSSGSAPSSALFRLPSRAATRGIAVAVSVFEEISIAGSS
jgi:hypothetical protein